LYHGEAFSVSEIANFSGLGKVLRRAKEGNDPGFLDLVAADQKSDKTNKYIVVMLAFSHQPKNLFALTPTVIRCARFDGEFCLQQGQRSSSLKRPCWIILLSLGFSILCVSQSPPSGGWAALFNGKDLSGWKNNGQEKWVVDQGTILCESTANKYGYLTTEKSYREFDLRLKFKGEASGNSGVFRVQRFSALIRNMDLTLKACKLR